MGVHVITSDLEGRTAGSLIGYDFPIKTVTYLESETAADICVSTSEITPPTQPSKASKTLVDLMGSKMVIDSMSAMTKVGKVQIFPDTEPEVTTTTITCPAVCFAAARSSESQKKSLLFGKHPSCAPECKM